MKKLAIAWVVSCLGLASASCNKPSEGDCRKAIQRIRELTGTAKIEASEDIEAAVRSCRGNASKASVRCAKEASSLEQLERCGLLSKEEIEDLK
jgi:hypothetical protein